MLAHIDGKDLAPSVREKYTVALDKIYTDLRGRVNN